MGKVVQEDGRMLLIAVLEVRGSKRGTERGGAAFTAEAAALLGSLSFWLPKLSGPVGSSSKWLRAVRLL